MLSESGMLLSGSESVRSQHLRSHLILIYNRILSPNQMATGNRPTWMLCFAGWREPHVSYARRELSRTCRCLALPGHPECLHEDLHQAGSLRYHPDHDETQPDRRFPPAHVHVQHHECQVRSAAELKFTLWVVIEGAEHKCRFGLFLPVRWNPHLD